jgi:7,8-dihydropterin-6-yl-methyl-4-(beta-D-ribofuranosyl)aminobenzene 5'-phosphate synthase
MKITIIYDNTAFRPDLKPDWGFSALVEHGNDRILFDTGTDGSILLGNMEKLGIEPASIDEVFISHDHFDHVGGLQAFLREHGDVTVYVPASLRKVRNAKEVIRVDEPAELHDHIYSTGELDHIEQSMAVDTGKGLVLVVGCSHPDMAHILDAASKFGRIYAIIGGMHGFSRYELFRDLALICPTHCTQHIAEIRSRYPDSYTEGGAGRIIEI